ncbi:MAG: type II secretion system protein GspM [Syntrophus sp. (in: bacteria)]
MKVKSLFFKIAIPITLILLGLFIYDYGFQRIESEEEILLEKRAVKTKTLEKFVTILSEQPLIENKYNELKERRKTENNKLFEGQTPALATALLQNIVKTMITERGGTVASERVEKPEALGRLKTIAVTMDVIMPGIKPLVDTLYAIETQTPFIVIRELDIRVRNFKEPKDLMVKMTVSALTGGR